MTVELKLRGGLVGRARLDAIDRAANLAHGPFEPGPLYPLVEPVFRLFARAQDEADPNARNRLLERYHRERAALPFQLEDAAGVVWPAAAIHIAPSASGDGAPGLELEVTFAAPPGLA